MSASSSSSNRRPSAAPQRQVAKAELPDPRSHTHGGGGVHQSASTPLLPSIQRMRDPIDHLSSTPSLPSVQSRLPQRKKPSAAKRRLQQNLYDFHCTTVFSMAPSEVTKPTALLPAMEGSSTARGLELMSTQPEVATIELPPPEPDDPYVISGLGLVDPSYFDEVFKYDWTHSDIERIVRDAVERKRIKSILQHHYRVLVLYFRQYAGKTALATSSAFSPHFASSLLQIPNRLSLLEDLNVQCVDPAKYGITETPLHREGLITFITHAAKMVAMHAPNAMQFRLFAAEGIDMSEAVRVLMVDHLTVYAQIQDATHFRDVFLLDQHDRQARRLRHMLAKHEASLSSFFFEAITKAHTATPSTGANRVRVRSDSHHPDRLPTPIMTTMTFHAFVTVLKTLMVIPSSTTARRYPAPAATATGTASDAPLKPAVVMLDENRAMRIFQQCLDLHAEPIGSSNARQQQWQLTYPQFIEALLRVTLVCYETTVCRGGFDICPGRHASDLCRCRLEPPAYDLAAFDDAIETVFARVHAHRMKQSTTKRSSLEMTSTMSLQPTTSGRRSSGLGRPRHHAIIFDMEKPSDYLVPQDSEDLNNDSA